MPVQQPPQPEQRSLGVLEKLVSLVIPSRWLYRFAEKCGTPDELAQLSLTVDPRLRTAWAPPAYIRDRR